MWMITWRSNHQIVATRGSKEQLTRNKAAPVIKMMIVMTTGHKIFLCRYVAFNLSSISDFLNQISRSLSHIEICCWCDNTFKGLNFLRIEVLRWRRSVEEIFGSLTHLFYSKFIDFLFIITKYIWFYNRTTNFVKNYN